MLNNRAFISFAAATAIALGAVITMPALAAGPGPEINATITGLALRGYDPVAYFTDHRPVLGDYSITAQYDGATYRFASESHKALFEKEPAKYVPQYGGFCAFGTAHGVKFDGDPLVWKIVEDKLYLNIAKKVAVRWREDIPGNIKTADEKWQVLKDKTPADLLQ
jgi:YHS domain-containing protein